MALWIEEGRETREALWRGRVITYRPGRLRLALRYGVSNKVAYNFLVKIGCHIEYATYCEGVFDVVIPAQYTLRLAGILATSPMFRYVEPDIVTKQEKENFD
jgi:hypothetical protein